MKKYILVSIKMTIVMIVVCCIFYFSVITLIGKMATGNGGGEKIIVAGKAVGYVLVGQKFTDDKYFSGRPSGVDYNAAGSAGSNKGPSNPDYLKIVQDRIDTFLVHNPAIKKEQITAEMITASGSGLDPHISPESAKIQVKRIAASRNIDEQQLFKLIDQNTQKPVFGPSIVHVLKLNIALDNLK
ncbi:MAG: potassium-transporting ATPase subunit C [Chitinophagaceae bacterium]|nr:potassium-transporting ATPase subunit C [Chitinophagaceae bacterium]